MNGKAAKRQRRADGWTPLERERTYALRQLQLVAPAVPVRLPWWRRALRYLREVSSMERGWQWGG